MENSIDVSQRPKNRITIWSSNPTHQHISRQSESCTVVLDILWPPWTTAHQAPLSMEFSRQEYWSGLPFLSSRDLSNPGIKPRSSTLQADSLPPEPQGKPKNAGVGSLSLLQGIFPTQGLNPGFPQCRQVPYHLGYQGSLILLRHTCINALETCT